MEILALILIVGALWAGYKVGTDAGRTSLLNAQSQSITSALSSENDFFRRTGLRGSFVLEGHESRTPVGFVLVNYSDLEKALQRIQGPEESGPLENLSAAPNQPFEQKYTPTAELARIVGAGQLTRTDATRIVWAYVEDHGLRDSQRSTQIDCDDALIAFTGQAQCSTFQLTRFVKDQLR